MELIYTLSEDERATVDAYLRLRKPLADDPADEEIETFARHEFARVLNDRRNEVEQRAVELARNNPAAQSALSAARISVIAAHVDDLRMQEASRRAQEEAAANTDVSVDDKA